jgi:hypothetical protein
MADHGWPLSTVNDSHDRADTVFPAPEKRKVGGSTPPLTTPSDLRRCLVHCLWNSPLTATVTATASSQAPAWYALAKTARWQYDYATAADLGSRGFEHGPVTPMGVQLASYEANSAALLGDTQRARNALQRSEMIAAAVPGETSSTSTWAFPAQRRVILRLSVLLRTGDPGGALEPQPTPTRPGPAESRTSPARGRRSAPVLGDIAPEFRIATVTGWLADLARQLASRRYARSPLAVNLRRQIRDFTAAALPSPSKEAG